MAHSTTIRCALLLATIWVGLVSSSLAGSDDFQVVVNAANPVSVVDRDFLRDAFLKKATNWPHGTSVRPIDLPASLSARDRFARDVLKKSLIQLRSFWSQRIFSGTGVPPPEAESPAAAVAYVLANPGAVAYLPREADPGRAKVVSVR